MRCITVILIRISTLLPSRSLFESLKSVVHFKYLLFYFPFSLHILPHTKKRYCLEKRHLGSIFEVLISRHYAFGIFGADHRFLSLINHHVMRKCVFFYIFFIYRIHLCTVYWVSKAFTDVSMYLRLENTTWESSKHKCHKDIRNISY